jgi:hypothetical protein
LKNKRRIRGRQKEKRNTRCNKKRRNDFILRKKEKSRRNNKERERD